MGFKFSLISGLFQTLLLVSFSVLVRYGDDATPSIKHSTSNFTSEGSKENDVRTYYPLFQDVHVMIYIGFGFLMTFLKKYGYGSVGYNFFIAALVAQWSTIINGFFNQICLDGNDNIKVSMQTLIGAEFAAAAVLITFGAVLGKVSRLQLLVIGIMEVVFYGVNNLIAVKYLKYADAGGSIVIHTFGAYFGLALSRVLYNEDSLDSPKEASDYQSDIFAMIGTVFLWLFWPSFNAALLPPDYVAQQRSIINTYFSLTAACVTTFVLSPMFQRSGGKWRLSMVHVQNATLAGGVAVGTVSNMAINPFGALLIGSCAGALSTVGYVYISPLLTSFTKIHDTCGVNNLHGMPGIFGGIAGAIVSASADFQTYGYDGLFSVWSARAPKMNTTEYWEMRNMGVKFNVGDQRTASVQAGYQIAGLVATIGVAIIGGIVTGMIVNGSFCDTPTQEQMYDDGDYWEIPDGEAEAVSKV
ncbi:ammonium transporter Rh type B-B [Pocillopora verrucosa]|uniref:ammonium transporter Rh type B-B n=1 Tax=Pocillopora verrucosa TaxID=203993 RepID=UPI0033420426